MINNQPDSTKMKEFKRNNQKKLKLCFWRKEKFLNTKLKLHHCPYFVIIINCNYSKNQGTRGPRINFYKILTLNEITFSCFLTDSTGKCGLLPSEQLNRIPGLFLWSSEFCKVRFHFCLDLWCTEFCKVRFWLCSFFLLQNFTNITYWPIKFCKDRSKLD